MTRLFRIATLAAVTMAPPAWADITVDDAWAVWKAQFAAYGLISDASETRDGDALQIGDIRLTALIPMGQGSGYVSFPGPRFSPMGDGRVAVTFPDTSLISLGGEFADEGSFAAALETRSTGSRLVMSGQPGEVVSDWTTDSMVLRLVDLAVSDEAVPDFSGEIRFGAMTGRTKTRIDDRHVMIDAASQIAEYDFTYAYSHSWDGDVRRVEGKGDGRKNTSRYTLVLPRTGLDTLGLHAQLADGLSMRLDSREGSTRSTEEERSGDTRVGFLNSETLDYAASLAFDASGLRIEASSGPFKGAGEVPEFPVPIALSGVAGDFLMLIPLLMGADQDATLRMALSDVTLDDGLWAMVDPQNQLPRDPVSVVMDLGAKVSILFEFLDIRALIGGARAPDIPVVARTVTLNDLRVAGAGAELTGDGDFTLDYDDFDTFDGMPALDGKAAFTLRGGNGLVDRLIAAGLLEEQNAMGVRMMLSMFAKPGEGSDVLTTEIEVKKTGEVLANGQRLQ